MNDWIKNTLGISAAGLFVLLATHGEAVVDALLAAWIFLLKLASTAPMGLASFALALALAVAAQAYLQRIVAALRCERSREVILSGASLAIGFAVMFLQLRTVNGALLGLLAGFSGPFAYQALAALVGLLRRGARP
jgi:hypothetical protein